jgi:hypothetical protein
MLTSYFLQVWGHNTNTNNNTPLPPGIHGARELTNERGLARVVDVEQIAVEVEVGVTASLDGRVGRLRGGSARREVELGENGEGRESDARDALGGEFGRVLDDFLDVRVGGTGPVGDDGCHGWYRVEVEAVQTNLEDRCVRV